MNRKGFTLIELIIVMAIIGLLAAIAIPQLTNTKERAHIAAMRSDLRNLVTVEESYFADSQKYSANLGGADRVASAGRAPPRGGWLTLRARRLPPIPNTPLAPDRYPAARRHSASLLRAKPPKGGDAESRGYSGSRIRHCSPGRQRRIAGGP